MFERIILFAALVIAIAIIMLVLMHSSAPMMPVMP